jgi:hypothetical protein
MPEPFLAILSHRPFAVAWCFFEPSLPRVGGRERDDWQVRLGSHIVSLQQLVLRLSHVMRSRGRWSTSGFLLIV